MKYAYWSFLGVLVVLGIVATVYFGLQPKPIPKIKPSFVESPERLGEALSQRLWMEIKDSPLIFLGVHPDKPDDIKVWKGFFESIKEPQLQYKVIVIDPKLTNKALIPYTDEADILNEPTKFIEGVKKAIQNQTRVAVVVPSIYASQAIIDNPINRLKKELPVPPLSLSIAQPTLSREEEAHTDFPCVTGQGDTAGLGSWGCLIQTKSRSLYKKKKESQKYIVLADQIGGTDYLVLLRFIP